LTGDSLEPDVDFKKHPGAELEDPSKLSSKQVRAEIEALRTSIEHHDRLYYVENRPVISDAAYDKLFRRLQDLEEAFPQFRSETSPTERVGGEPAGYLKTVRHSAPMLSLAAVVDEEEVASFHASIVRACRPGEPVYVIEPKFDGLSIEVVYENGLFKRGSTRGDGVTGEDVSENLKTIRSLPLRLPVRSGPPRFLSVRAEVFLPRREFQKLNKQRIEHGQLPFANPRNAAAGTVRRLDPREVARCPLDVAFYDVLRIEGESLRSHWGVLERFAEWSLKTDRHVARCGSMAEIRRVHARLDRERERLDYEIDGVVIKVDDLALREKLGARHRSPRWALAWKFAPRQEITTLEDIVVQVGMTGILTPVALLAPVDVGGVTVSRATLHNEREVRRKRLGIGDRVRIARAGDVIPEVIERVGRARAGRGREFRMPRTCPACGTRVVAEGAYHVCPAGLACRAQLAAHVVHYGSREAMDIEGLGHKTARRLVGKGLVKTLADLYALSIDDLLELEGFARKSAESLHRAIRSATRPPLDRFLYALGIRHVGARVARALADSFGSLEKLGDAGEAELLAVPAVGREIARSVCLFFADRDNRRVLARMAKLGVDVRPAGARRGRGRLAGKTFVFTGALAHCTRAEAERRVEELGGRASSSVSRTTDYVVAGEDPGSKLGEAKKYGVKVIDERQFERLSQPRASG
jgi:DNA ligase (NAD+)